MYRIRGKGEWEMKLWYQMSKKMRLDEVLAALVGTRDERAVELAEYRVFAGEKSTSASRICRWLIKKCACSSRSSRRRKCGRKQGAHEANPEAGTRAAPLALQGPDSTRCLRVCSCLNIPNDPRFEIERVNSLNHQLGINPTRGLYPRGNGAKHQINGGDWGS